MSGRRAEYVTLGRRKLNSGKVHSLHWNDSYGCQTKEDEVGGARNTNERNQKRVPNFDGKFEDWKALGCCPCTGLDRPRGLQKVEAPRIFRQWAHEGGKVVALRTIRL